MTAICPSVIHLCRVRFTRIDEFGDPVAGPNNVYVSDKPMVLTMTPDILTGETKDLKSGCDALIATYRGQDIPKRTNLELDLGNISPGLEEMLTGGSIVTNSGEDPIGVNLREACDTQSPYVVTEAWQDLYECDRVPSAPYHYRHWTFPSSRWVKGPETAQNDFGQPKYTGFTVGNASWGVGIFGDLDSPVGPAGQWVYTNTIPVAACDYITQAIT